MYRKLETFLLPKQFITLSIFLSGGLFFFLNHPRLNSPNQVCNDNGIFIYKLNQTVSRHF